MKTNLTRKHGSGLLTAMIVIVVLSIVTASFVAIGKQRAFMARKLADRAKSIAIAEAGLNEAYSRLATNLALRNDPDAFPATDYGDGSYDVTISNIDTLTMVLISTGRCNSASAWVKADVRDYGDGDDDYTEWPVTTTNFAVLTGGSFGFGGCGDLEVTNATTVHSNDKIDLSGGTYVGSNITITSSEEISGNGGYHVEGNVMAPVLNVDPDQIDGTITTQAVPKVKIPKVDMTPFLTWAQDNGEVYTNYTLSGGSYTASGGVMWVIGDVDIQAGAVFNGTIVATGDIKFNGGLLTASEYGFALVSLGGNIDFQSNGTVDGIIYARNGDYKHTGSGTLIGQAVVSGTTTKQGASGVFLNDNPVPYPPGSTSWHASSNILVISAWQK